MAQKVERGEFEAFDASGYRVAIVVALFNRDVCDALLENALEKCKTYKIPRAAVAVYKVPGSVEIPVILRALAESKKFDALVALGTVIRGQTPHFDYVCKIASEGVLRVMLDFGIPVGFGILTCENHEQALARVSSGGGAVEAALQSAKIIKSITN